MSERKRLFDDIMQLCFKKQWCESNELYQKYKEHCVELWKEYDTHCNYRFNICGSCRKMKRTIVKPKWSEAERYPMGQQLVCFNNNCKFYLVVNTDLKIESL